MPHSAPKSPSKPPVRGCTESRGPGRCPARAEAGPEGLRRWTRSPASVVQGLSEVPGPAVPGPPPGEDAGGGGERARPRDDRYKSAPDGRSAPAAPPRRPRLPPAPGFSEPPTCGCGCGSRPHPRQHHDRYAPRRPPPPPPRDAGLFAPRGPS